MKSLYVFYDVVLLNVPLYVHIQKSTLISILQHPAFSIFGTMYVVFWLFELGKSLQRNSFMQIGEPTML